MLPTGAARGARFGQSVAVKRAGPLVQDGHPKRRRRGYVAGALLAVLVLAVGVGGVVWLKRHSIRHRWESRRSRTP